MTVDEIKLYRSLYETIYRIAAPNAVDTSRMRAVYEDVFYQLRAALQPNEREIADQHDGLREAAVLVRERTGCSLLEASDRVKQYQAAWGPL
jgi:hypothetical protein